MLRVAVPNKGALSESAAHILSEAGYRRRTDPKDLTVVDPANNVEFFFLRPKDIAIYVGSGELDFGITGRDLAAESMAPVQERLALGFGSSTFRYAAPAGRDWTVADLAGKRVASAYPNLVRKDLADKGIEATVIRLDGAVEISIQLGVADADEARSAFETNYWSPLALASALFREPVARPGRAIVNVTSLIAAVSGLPTTSARPVPT